MSRPQRRSPDDDRPQRTTPPADRLAELVSELTGTEPGAARYAVRAIPHRRDALEVVANAMISVDQPPPEGFRVTGFLRTGEEALTPEPPPEESA
ncbi:MAG: hypothetical protein JJU45_06715 [Acidimicrobiia bacterium]|nr:hypothetical protein [Acidimicrobiia bacterium]